MKKLILILLLLVPGISWGRSVGGMRSDIRRAMNDVPDPKVRYTNDFIFDLMNKVQRDVVNQTWCLQTMTDVTLTAGTTYYSLPTGMIAIIQVDFKDSSNKVAELSEISERALKQENPDHERTGGKPNQYFVRYSTYQVTTMQIGFYPAPSTVSSTGTVRIRYYNQATNIDDDDDVFFDGYRFLIPYDDVIQYGVIARLKLLEGDINGSNFYLQMYKEGLAVMRDRLGRMPNYSPSFGGASK